MSSITYTDNVTVIPSAWLNDVNTVAYTLFGDGSSYDGILRITATTDATSITTGTSRNAGGTSIQKALWVGGLANIAGAVTLQTTLGVTGNVTFDGNFAVGNFTGLGTAASGSSACVFSAATTALSSCRLPHGTAPTAPVNGDMWTTTAGLYVRINGATVGPLS